MNVRVAALESSVLVCLILFAFRTHRRYPLIVAANRDEWFHRPTAAARFWDDRPAILAGRDLEHRGTWLGLTRAGRFGAITNFRDPLAHRADARSRGHIVRDYLDAADHPAAFGAALAASGPAFNGFNFLGGTLSELIYYSNRASDPVAVTPGVHGLSNHLLDSDWPKVVRGKIGLAEAAASDTIDPAVLFGLLDDRAPAAAEALPDTGVAPEWEKALSAAHIIAQPRTTAEGEASHYGTRSATVILVDQRGTVQFAERTFDVAGRITSVTAERFELG